MPPSPPQPSADKNNQAKPIATGSSPARGDLRASAWREYLKNHPEEFANELQQAAEVVRNGSLADLAAWVSGDNEERARQAAARIRAQR